MKARKLIMLIAAAMLVLPILACGGDGGTSVPDSDGDGWTDAQEQSAGTNPYSVDTDGDGYWDPQDPNPLDPSVPVGIATPTPNPIFTPWPNPTFTPMPIPIPSLTPTPTPTPTPIPVGALIEVRSYRWGKGYGMSIGGEDDFLFVEGSATNVGTETLEVVVVMNCWSSRTLVRSEERECGAPGRGL